MSFRPSTRAAEKLRLEFLLPSVAEHRRWRHQESGRNKRKKRERKKNEVYTWAKGAGPESAESIKLVGNHRLLEREPRMRPILSYTNWGRRRVRGRGGKGKGGKAPSYQKAGYGNLHTLARRFCVQREKKKIRKGSSWFDYMSRSRSAY